MGEICVRAKRTKEPRRLSMCTLQLGLEALPALAVHNCPCRRLLTIGLCCIVKPMWLHSIKVSNYTGKEDASVRGIAGAIFAGSWGSLDPERDGGSATAFEEFFIAAILVGIVVALFIGWPPSPGSRREKAPRPSRQTRELRPNQTRAEKSPKTKSAVRREKPPTPQQQQRRAETAHRRKQMLKAQEAYRMEIKRRAK